MPCEFCVKLYDAVHFLGFLGVSKLDSHCSKIESGGLGYRIQNPAVYPYLWIGRYSRQIASMTLQTAPKDTFYLLAPCGLASGREGA